MKSCSWSMQSDGLTNGDRLIAEMVRKSGKTCQVVVNKVDGSNPDQVQAEFFALGFEHLRLISAAHRKGTGVLIDQILVRRIRHRKRR